MDTTPSANFPPEDISPSYTEEQKQAKLQEWWGLLDKLANGNPFTEQDFDLVLDNVENPELKRKLQGLFDPVMEFDLRKAFIDSFNKVRGEFGAGFKALSKQEQAVRKEVGAMYFPEPKEGTNNADIGNGWKLKYTHKIDRKVDEAAFDATTIKLREMGINTDKLTRTVHELATTEYRALESLNEEAFKVFQECLIIKPGSPTLELVPPKTRK